MQSSTETHIKQWLTELSKIDDNECYSPTFWKPYHLVTVGLAMKKAGAVSFTLPEEFQSYAARMKLWDSVGMEPPVAVNERSPNGRFLPVYKFNQSIRDVNEVAENLARVVVQTTSKEYQQSMSGCLQELVSNFFDHANSDDELI